MVVPRSTHEKTVFVCLRSQDRISIQGKEASLELLPPDEAQVQVTSSTDQAVLSPTLTGLEKDLENEAAPKGLLPKGELRVSTPTATNSGLSVVQETPRARETLPTTHFQPINQQSMAGHVDQMESNGSPIIIPKANTDNTRIQLSNSAQENGRTCWQPGKGENTVSEDQQNSNPPSKRAKLNQTPPQTFDAAVGSFTDDIQATAADESQGSVLSSIEVQPTKNARKAPARKPPTISTRKPSIAKSSDKENEPHSSPASGASPSSPAASVLNVCFASTTGIDSNGRIMEFLRKNGGSKVDKADTCDVFCVGKGKPLKKTGNFVLAVAQGKPVINDDWLVQSSKQRVLLDYNLYAAKDRVREKEWGFTLADAVKRGRDGLRPFEGWTIYFTPSVKKELGNGYGEITHIAQFAGAKVVLALLSPKFQPDSGSSLLISVHDDELVRNTSHRSYTKDLITTSVLRGKLDVGNDEFLARNSMSSQESSEGRKRKR